MQQRLDKGRRLLAESERLRGSTDLQVEPQQSMARRRGKWRLPTSPLQCSPRSALQLFVTHFEWVERVHRAFLDEARQERQGLTALEKEQVRSLGWLGG